MNFIKYLFGSKVNIAYLTVYTFFYTFITVKIIQDPSEWDTWMIVSAYIFISAVCILFFYAQYVSYKKYISRLKLDNYANRS